MRPATWLFGSWLIGCASIAFADAAAPEDPSPLERLATAVHEDPHDRSARWNYGFLLYRHGRLDDADRQFRLADEDGPDPYSALMRGVIAEQQLRYAAALRHYGQSTDLPGNAESAERARANLALLETHLADLRRFERVDGRLNRDLIMGILALGSVVGALLLLTRRPPVP